MIPADLPFPIPEAVLEQHIAILGKTGSGKTYAAKTIIEPLLARGRRVCIIDPTNAWHGLRSSATGKSAGFPIAIFGGPNADFPLEGVHGEALAEIVGTSNTPSIICTKLMRIGERTKFFTDFAEALMRVNKGALHLVIDEAHRFAPKAQKLSGASSDMLNAANELLGGGRSAGLRVILITQRSAKLHNDSLTQAEVLIAMRVVAPHDRRAVNDWIKDNADEAKGKEIVSSLAKLKTGVGWVWAPEVDVLEQVTFPRLRTFDSSRAPTGDEVVAGAVMAPIDSGAIATRLKEVAAQAIADHPDTLKAEIRRLNGELAKRPTQSAAPAAATVDADQLYRDGYRQGHEHGYGRGLGAALDRQAFFVDLARDTLQAVRTIGRDADMRRDEFEARVLKAPPEPTPWSVDMLGASHRAVPKRDRADAVAELAGAVDARLTHLIERPGDAIPPPRDPAEAKPSEQRVVDSIAFWHSVGIEAPSREQVAMVAGYTASSGRFRNLMGGLRSAGVVEYPEEGRARLAAGHANGAVMSSAQARELMLGVLSPSQLKMVRSVPPNGELSRHEVAQTNGYEPSSGRFRNLIGSLRTLNIFVYPSEGRVAHSPWAAELLR